MSTEAIYEKWNKNPMTKPRIDKVTVNISVGKSGEPLEKAARILEQLTGQKPTYRKAKRTVKDFGVRRGENIACLVTLRKNMAEAFLKKAFSAVGNKLTADCLDRDGNFTFGISEHIELPEVRYDPALGIVGMDICVTLGKAGYRVKNRRFKSKVGTKHKVTPEETVILLKEAFGIDMGKAA